MEKNGRKGSLVMEPTERWSPQDASELYDVARWGKGYFSVGDNGHIRVHPEKDPQRSIDLKQLIDTLVLRGISLPILVYAFRWESMKENPQPTATATAPTMKRLE